MMRTLRIPCWFGRHTPRRDRVRWDGATYVGYCRACGEPIRRTKPGLWVAGVRDDSTEMLAQRLPTLPDRPLKPDRPPASRE